MSCYICADKFKLFNKEIGCANCGFGFCSKCCKNKTNVPKKGNQVSKVCDKCFQILTNKSDIVTSQKQTEITPPKNFLKLVESNRSKQVDQIPPEDKQLMNRLEILKNNKGQSNAASHSDQDLEARLRSLQGTSSKTNNLSNLPAKELIKTPDDLITKIMDEVQIEKKHGDFEAQELEKLEKRLRDLSTPLEAKQGATNAVDAILIESKPKLDPHVVKLDPNDAIMQRLLKEAEESQRKLNNENDTEDFFCCICNEDSIPTLIKCIDCDSDLYCSRCYKQTHNTGEYKRHQKVNVEHSTSGK